MESTGQGGRKRARFRRVEEKVQEVEIESTREKLARAADTGHSSQHDAQGSTYARCGAGAGCSAIEYQSLHVSCLPGAGVGARQWTLQDSLQGYLA